MNVLLTGTRLKEFYRNLDCSMHDIGKRESYSNVYLSETWEATSADSICTRMVYWILEWTLPYNIHNIESAFKICLSEYNKAVSKLSTHHDKQEFSKLKDRLDFLTDLVRANQKSFEHAVERKTYSSYTAYYTGDHLRTVDEIYRSKVSGVTFRNRIGDWIIGDEEENS